MSLLRKNKVLETEVVKECRNLEVLTYALINKWKKTYRYTLTESFRRYVSNLRECVISGLRTDKTAPKVKMFYYDNGLCNLDNIEYLLEIMVSNSFNIISDKQFADFAILVDKIGGMIDKLMRSLKKNNNEKTPESQSYGDERDENL